jgi:hypothetical protein
MLVDRMIICRILTTCLRFLTGEALLIILLFSYKLSPIGYQVFHKDYPACLPTKSQTGLFGQLFGITYLNPTPSDDPSIPTHLIRAISHSEYIAAFGYDANFNCLVAADSECLDYLDAMVPARTMQSIQKVAMNNLNEELKVLTSFHKDRFNIDMSVSAFLNGIINEELPSDKKLGSMPTLEILPLERS